MMFVIVAINYNILSTNKGIQRERQFDWCTDHRWLAWILPEHSALECQCRSTN